MRYLIDTGVLVRLGHRPDALNLVVRQAIRELLADGVSLATTTQNIAEFWNLSTRPAAARGGFDLTIAETSRRLRMIERYVQVLHEPESGYRKWKELVVNQKVMGRQVHDARIAASMKAYRIRRILTLNAADFVRYRGIEAVTPQDVITA